MATTVKTTKPGKPKGTLLEDFSAYLLSSVHGFIVRYKRAKAKKSKTSPEHDYDLIIQNTSQIFPEFGTYILIECKNRKEKTGYAEIAKFIHKLHSHRCNTGIIISMEGVVYDEFNPTLERAFNQDAISVIVLDKNDLENIIDGSINLATILRKRYEQTRFKVKK